MSCWYEVRYTNNTWSCSDIVKSNQCEQMHNSCPIYPTDMRLSCFYFLNTLLVWFCVLGVYIYMVAFASDCTFTFEWSPHSSLSPERTHLFKVTVAPLPFPLTRCIMSVLCPIDQMTITAEPRRRQKTHLSLLGPRTPRDPNSQTVAQLQSRAEAPSHYPCTEERGEVNDP